MRGQGYKASPSDNSLGQPLYMLSHPGDLAPLELVGPAKFPWPATLYSTDSETSAPERGLFFRTHSQAPKLLLFPLQVIKHAK